MIQRALLCLAISFMFLSPRAHSCCSCVSYFNTAPSLWSWGEEAMLTIMARYHPKVTVHQAGVWTREDYLKRIQALQRQKHLPEFSNDDLSNFYYTGYLKSNSYQTALQFMDEAFADPRVKGGWNDLIRLRHDILAMFSTRKRDEILTEIRALDKRQVGGYKTYLEGVYYFYQGEYEAALKAFRKLMPNKNPSLMKRVKGFFTKQSEWLEETATYMEARVLLLMAQEKFNGYRWDKASHAQLNGPLLEKSLALFQAYIKAYPQGRYVDSARNLQRRFYYFLGQQDKLDAALREKAYKEIVPGVSYNQLSELFGELGLYYEGKVNPKEDPVLLLVYGLLAQNRTPEEMRKGFDALAAEESRFGVYPGLYLYTRAALLSRMGSYQELVDLIPNVETVKKDDSLGVAIEVMRGRAFTEIGSYPEAIAAFRKVQHAQNDQIDLYILQSHLAFKSPKDELLRDLSPGKVRAAFIQEGLTTAELQALSVKANLSKDIIRDVKKTLLRRYLLIGQFDRALKMDNFDEEGFADLRPHLEKILKNPNDNKSLLQIAKGLIHGPIGISYVVGELQWVYRDAVIDIPFKAPIRYLVKVADNTAHTKQKSDVEAEALHLLAGYCFHGSADAQSCKWCYWGGPIYEEMEQIRKKRVPGWFRRLHSKYKGTNWAKKTPYYY